MKKQLSVFALHAWAAIGRLALVLLGMLALVSIFLIPMKSALILLVSAWLISPAGLPLAAQKLLEVLYVGCEWMQDWVMG
mgnify:CR=1 FL=1